MELVVYAAPSSRVDPGHLIVGNESPGEDGCYYGFRFDPVNLPAEYRSFRRWRDFFQSHSVVGYIADERDFVDYIKGRLDRAYYEKRVVCEMSVESILPPPELRKPFARYSFNPDDTNIPGDPCYNCVTWAVGVANQLIAGFLPIVPQGRLQVVLKILTRIEPEKGE